MQPEEMILVSVDDHLVEPPNLFEGRIANKHADETPRVIRQPDGSEVWTFNGAWYSFDPFEHRTREQRTVGATPGPVSAKLDV
ncbi:hypothetical protein A5690_10690 [Mycobacterium intracellulare]|uniref:hypothetical protein n=1 Tax=Mycobacterium intracellulare TaxID=1767 RepID=UPI0007EACE33|nr:hypothetical protein [Mycobacterium intracellulare]OBH35157.1 hypothetical protein A5690_10690 [Mycobacterium intracellulare]